MNHYRCYVHIGYCVQNLKWQQTWRSVTKSKPYYIDAENATAAKEYITRVIAPKLLLEFPEWVCNNTRDKECFWFMKTFNPDAKAITAKKIPPEVAMEEMGQPSLL